MSQAARRGRIGIRFEGFETLEEARSIAAAAEAAGASSVWMTQHLGGRDALTLAGVIAGATRSIRVVPSNLSPFIAHPTTTAMALATLAEGVPGRVAASVGIGNQLDLSQSGIATRDAEVAVCDFVAALERLFAREPVHLQGVTFRLEGAKLTVALPAPVPLFVTALQPSLAGRAGSTGAGLQLSAGFFPGFAARCVQAYEAAALAAGTSAAAVAARPRAAFAYFGTDAPESFEGVRRKLAYLLRNKLMAENLALSGLAIDQAAIIDCVSRRDLDGAARRVPDEAVEAFAVAGSLKRCGERAEAFFAAGIDELLINVGSTAVEREAALALIRAVNG